MGIHWQNKLLKFNKTGHSNSNSNSNASKPNQNNTIRQNLQPKEFHGSFQRTVKLKTFFRDRYLNEVNADDQEEVEDAVEPVEIAAENDVANIENGESKTLCPSFGNGTTVPNDVLDMAIGVSHRKKPTAFFVENIMAMPSRSKNTVNPYVSTHEPIQIAENHRNSHGGMNFSVENLASSSSPVDRSSVIEYSSRSASEHELMLNLLKTRENIDQEMPETNLSKARKIEITSTLRPIPGSDQG